VKIVSASAAGAAKHQLVWHSLVAMARDTNLMTTAWNIHPNATSLFLHPQDISAPQMFAFECFEASNEKYIFASR
jgi:hypothetical protein